MANLFGMMKNQFFFHLLNEWFTPPKSPKSKAHTYEIQKFNHPFFKNIQTSNYF